MRWFCSLQMVSTFVLQPDGVEGFVGSLITRLKFFDILVREPSSRREDT